METLPPQGMVLSTHILLVYCQMKNNVSIAQIKLVMESESVISAFFFPYIYVFFSASGNYIPQNPFLATGFIWLRSSST